MTSNTYMFTDLFSEGTTILLLQRIKFSSHPNYRSCQHYYA